MSKRFKSPNGPFHMHFDGLHAQIKSKHAKTRTVRSLLVSHLFVELWRIIENDKSFDKTIFNQLSESERDFMAYALKRCKIDSRDFDKAYNLSIGRHIDRLNMIQSAMKIGNDAPELKTEMKQILDKLYDKGVFSHQFYSQFKNCAANPSAYAIQFTMQPYVSVSGYKLASGALPVSTSGYTPQLLITDTGASSFSAIIGFAQGAYPSAPQASVYSSMSNYTPTIDPVQSVIVGLSNLDNPLASNNQVLHSFTGTGVGFGGLINTSQGQGVIFTPMQGSTNEITLSLYDQNMLPLKLVGPNLCVRLLVRRPGTLTVGGIQVVPPPSYCLGITEGSAAASKALVLNSTPDVSGINALSATSLSGTLQTASQPNVASLGTLINIATSGSLNMSGVSISSSEISVLDGAIAGTAVPTKALILNGSSSISGIASLSATSLTGTLQTAAQPNITSVGTLASLTLSGGISGVTTISASGALVITGGVGVGGQLSATSLSGTIQTAAQPNITSIGTRSSLTVSGGLSASTLTGTLQTASQPNITSIGTLASLSVSGGLSASTLTGTLQTASQPNITSMGTLASLSVSGGLSASTLTGTLQTAAQPNITSLGGLTNLNVRSGSTTGEVANISMPAQAAGYSSWITIGKISSGNEGGRIGYYHDSTYANQYIYITHNNNSPILTIANNSSVGINNLNPTYDLDVTGQVRITRTLLFAGTTRTISNVAAYGGGTITTSGDITCGGSLKGYLGYGNQSTISTVGVLTEVVIGSTGVYNSQEYLLINGNGSNYLDGAYTRMCSFYGSNVTPAWFQIEVPNGSKTVSTSATWLGNNSDTDLRFGTNNSTYGICLGGTNRGRWGFGTTSPAYGVHNTLTVSTTLDAGGTGVA
ncbi:unnamed protein product [Phytophthora fragariaefolia]|uniref:Unnamed protein product n=1 Tax=Phytophthora fragariaefolia TaxID=1490495 RepID=A0A9W7CYL1_9STRA|nr:unnamed protein product [Phytophthora fragariaefolia]